MANIRTPIYLYLPVHRGQHWQRDRRAEEQHCQRDRRAEEQYFQVLSLKLLLSVLGRALQISEDNARHFKSTISMQMRAQILSCTGFRKTAPSVDISKMI